jgi:hypothetical protein
VGELGHCAVGVEILTATIGVGVLDGVVYVMWGMMLTPLCVVTIALWCAVFNHQPLNGLER